MSKLKKKVFLWNHNAKARFETKGFHDLNSERSYAFIWISFINVLPKLIQFDIPTQDWSSFPALGGKGVFISGIVNPILNSVQFLFWVSVDLQTTNHFTTFIFNISLFMNVIFPPTFTAPFCCICYCIYKACGKTEGLERYYST